MTLASFTHPPTGTRHILKSDPEQATLRFPESDEFSAQPYCGTTEVKLRHGDLADFPAVVNPLEYPDACTTCLRAAPTILTEEPL